MTMLPERNTKMTARTLSESALKYWLGLHFLLLMAFLMIPTVGAAEIRLGVTALRRLSPDYLSWISRLKLERMARLISHG